MHCAALFLARIIGLLSLAVALGGCSAIKLGYGSLTQLGSWWLDGYFDFDDTQNASVRDDLARIHAWHRANELPRYGQLLQRLERVAPGDLGAEQVCGFEPDVRARIDALRQRAEPALTAHALTIQPAQIEHLERKYQQRNREFQKEWVQLAPEDLVDKRLQQLVDRAEILYGRLDDGQRALLRQQLRASAYSPAIVGAERRRRQQEVLALSRKFSSGPTGIAEARAAVRGVLDRVVHSPDPAYVAYADTMRTEICRGAAALHNSMRPAQREHAVRRLRGWQRDIADLAAPS